MWRNWSGGGTSRETGGAGERESVRGITWPRRSRAERKTSAPRKYQVKMNSQNRKRFKYSCGRLNKSTTGPLVTRVSPERSPREMRKGMAETVWASAETTV